MTVRMTTKRKLFAGAVTVSVIGLGYAPAAMAENSTYGVHEEEYVPPMVRQFREKIQKCMTPMETFEAAAKEWKYQHAKLVVEGNNERAEQAAFDAMEKARADLWNGVTGECFRKEGIR